MLRLDEQHVAPFEERIDAVFVLDEGIIANYRPDTDTWRAVPLLGSKRVELRTAATDGALLLFDALVSEILSDARGAPFSIAHYVQDRLHGKRSV